MNAAAGGAPKQLRSRGGNLAPGRVPLAGRWTSSDLLSTMAVILIMFGITGYAVSARIGYAEENLDELLVEAWEQSDAVTNPAADPTRLLEMVQSAIEDGRKARAPTPTSAAQAASATPSTSPETPPAQVGQGRAATAPSAALAPSVVATSGVPLPPVAPGGVPLPAAAAASPGAISAGAPASSGTPGAGSNTTGRDDPARSASQPARSGQDGNGAGGGGNGATGAGAAPVRPPVPPTRERAQGTPQPADVGTVVPTAVPGEELPPGTVVPVVPAPATSVPEEPVLVPPVLTAPPVATIPPVATVPPENTATPERTATPRRTATPEHTATAQPTATGAPALTSTPVPTSTPPATSPPAPTSPPMLTPTPAPTSTPTLTPTPTSGYVVIQTNAPSSGLFVVNAMRPGGCVTQNVTVSNVGRATFQTYSLATAPVGPATLLWTDQNNGLQLRVSRGSSVLYDGVINVPTLDLGLAMAPGDTDLLALSVCLPAAANNSVQGLSQTVSITWTATAN
ncbi:MAG: hypothetical protein IT306_27870 [Chloroflexi bacterium]|nr:hypothetical protein [Chloroflexota bacterium]